MRARDDDVLESLRELRAADERRRRSPLGSPERHEAELEVEALAREIFEAGMLVSDGLANEGVTASRGSPDEGSNAHGEDPNRLP
ncbi:MAG TPA: hypothetical protein VFI28_04665 [Candidatus Limnocylindrales bacterium]|nr:hypothetical protein [Candidatus Limnocylindrales bacterium]